jgi:hypothetical protein
VWFVATLPLIYFTKLLFAAANAKGLLL